MRGHEGRAHRANAALWRLWNDRVSRDWRLCAVAGRWGAPSSLARLAQRAVPVATVAVDAPGRAGAAEQVGGGSESGSPVAFDRFGGRFSAHYQHG